MLFSFSFQGLYFPAAEPITFDKFGLVKIFAIIRALQHYMYQSFLHRVFGKSSYIFTNTATYEIFDGISFSTVQLIEAGNADVSRAPCINKSNEKWSTLHLVSSQFDYRQIEIKSHMKWNEHSFFNLLAIEIYI